MVYKYKKLLFSIIYSIIAVNRVLAFDSILDDDLDNVVYSTTKANNRKDWTFAVYIAADNDLRGFAARNIKQMSEIGSNSHVNIVVQLDIRITGNKKITRRYYIEHDKIYHMNSDDPTSQKMDSGDPKTLISFSKWAIENYPANNYALVLWNHGAGIIDPDLGRIINPAELFNFNPASHKLELDRSIGFLDFINSKQEPSRGVCWDDSTGNYLTNQKLDAALREITTKLLNGKKLAIIGFDACLMAMLEVANIAKKYAHIMVCSQEVELGPGWDYQKALSIFNQGSPNPAGFAKHIVDVYYDTYSKITNDFTQSALNLDIIDELENNLNTIANLLLDCLRKQSNNSVKNAVQASRSKVLCTHFDEPSYLDLHHLLTNLQNNLKLFTFTNQTEGNSLKNALNAQLETGKKLIKQIVLANRVGKNLNLAQGISIYFPERNIHSSYRKTQFAATNSWISFITQYLLL